MDEALEIRPSAIVMQCDPIQAELHEVVDFNQLRRPRPGHEKAIRMSRMSNGDMPERIQDSLIHQDPVSQYEFVVRRLEVVVAHPHNGTRSVKNAIAPA
jgi:hypothetical protein